MNTAFRFGMGALAALLLVAPVGAARSPWTTYASVREVRGMVVQGGNLWVATTGGVVRIATATASVETIYTNVDGLAALDTRVIVSGGGATLVAGDAEAGISVWQPAGGWLPYVLSATGLKTLDLAVAAPGTYYLAGPDGVSLFRNGEIRETYNDFGTQFNADVRAVILDDDGYLWAGTADGVARTVQAPDAGNLSLPNLMDPDSWTLHAAGALPDVRVTTLYAAGGAVWVGTEGGIARYALGTWGAVHTSAAVNVFAERGDTLFAGTAAGILAYGGSGWNRVSVAGLPDTNITALAFDGNGTMWIGMNERGIAYRTAGSSTFTVLPIDKLGPWQNFVSRIALDADTAVWLGGTGAHAISRANTGTGIWTNYNLHMGGRTTSIKIDPFGNRWFCSWGQGVRRYDRNGIWHQYLPGNSVISSSIDDSTVSYPVVNDIIIRADGSVLACNYSASSLRAKGVIQTDTSLQTGTILYGAVNGSYHYSAMAEDRAGYVWIGTGLHDGVGAEAVDRWGRSVLKVEELSGLANGYVNRITVDFAGRTWLATNSGVVMYADGALSQKPTFGRVSTPYQSNIVLNNIIVNDVDYDSSGNIWAATDGYGLVQFSSSGKILAQYTTTNSGLVNNRVRAVAVNRVSGEIWLGTYNGISRFASAFTPPKSNYEELTVYPNPFKPAIGDGRLRFRGVINGSQLSIYTASGQLVRKLAVGAADGMTAVWDGLNGAGAPVTAGLYHYVLYSEQYGTSTNGSFAVIR